MGYSKLGNFTGCLRVIGLLLLCLDGVIIYYFWISRCINYYYYFVNWFIEVVNMILFIYLIILIKIIKMKRD